jgi:hypothetical protein
MRCRFPLGGLLAAVLVVCAAGEAAASGARVRWAPSDDSRVIGYNVYVRAAHVRYNAPIDVGLPPRAADGTMSVVVNGFFPRRAYHIAVAAYTDEDVESDLSAELTLGDTDSCFVDECVSATECDIGPVRDGTWCMHAGETDPCAALGACVTGKCAASAALPGVLTTSRMRIAARSAEGRLTARATFPIVGTIDPTTGGAAFELADANGRILYRASVPGEAFDAFRGGKTFRYVATRRRARDYNGLRVVGLFLSGRTATVSVRADAFDLRAALEQPALHWTVRFGRACARDLDLTCRRSITGGIFCG